MRLTITLATSSGHSEIRLPIAHNHLLQAAVYHLIEQPALSKFLHERGFALGKRKFKLFAFSRLLGSAHIDKQSQEICFASPLKFVICSPVPLLLQEVAMGLLRKGQMRFGGALVEVKSVAVTDPQVEEPPIHVRMLSPVVVYSTLERGSGKYTYYYSPFEGRFRELVLANLAKKYVVIFGKAPRMERFACTPSALRPGDFKIVRYKDTIIKGWMGTYQLEGDADLLKVALTAGLGSKNSQGFGCCVLESEAEALLGKEAQRQVAYVDSRLPAAMENMHSGAFSERGG